MQATGLQTAQPTYNRNLLGILLMGVVLAAVVTALIIVTSGQAARGTSAAPAPDANAISQSRVQFFADEHANGAAPTVLTPSRVQFFADEKSAGATSGSVPWIQPDRGDPAPKSVSSPRHISAK